MLVHRRKELHQFGARRWRCAGQGASVFVLSLEHEQATMARRPAEILAEIENELENVLRIHGHSVNRATGPECRVADYQRSRDGSALFIRLSRSRMEPRAA